MKKIKRIKELRKEQDNLTRRQKELKQLIHSDWIEIREAAKLKNILKNRLRFHGKKTSEKRASWIERVSSNAGLFARKVALQAENKIENKVSEKIESVLNSFFNKRNKQRRS